MSARSPACAEPDGEPHVLVEALLGQGVVSSPLSRYAGVHTRICRPVGLSPDDLARVTDYAKSRIGNEYDLRNMVDLARYLLPNPPVPQRWRRRMLSLGSGSPTRAICSTLIAAGLPRRCTTRSCRASRRCRPRPADTEAVAEFQREVLHIRHHSLYAPRDFDVSPYFEMVKPTIALGFDYRGIRWDRVEHVVAPEIAAEAAPHHGVAS